MIRWSMVAVIRNNRLVLFACLLWFWSTRPSALICQPQVKIPKTTEVELRLTESVSSATAQNGQVVKLTTSKEVIVDGLVIIPKGSSGIGTVRHLKKALVGRKDGYLRVVASAVTLADGTQLKLNEYPPGEDDCGDMGPCWAMGIAVAPLWPLILVRRAHDQRELKEEGKDMVLPIGDTTTAYTARTATRPRNLFNSAK